MEGWRPFVLLPPYNSTDSLLVVAGGGGGAAGSLSTSGNLMGNDATQATNGTSGISSNPGEEAQTVQEEQFLQNAGAGAGFLANGGGNISSASGKSISNGALGGFNQLDSGIGGFEVVEVDGTTEATEAVVVASLVVAQWKRLLRWRWWWFI